jgi:hypothetical protein
LDCSSEPQLIVLISYCPILQPSYAPGSRGGGTHVEGRLIRSCDTPKPRQARYDPVVLGADEDGLRACGTVPS